MITLVCGGRTFGDEKLVFSSLDALELAFAVQLIVVQGGAHGADKLGWKWAMVRGRKNFTEHAEWRKYGRSAGPKRNTRMLELYKPKLAVAFPGGAGTADMVRKATAAGVAVWKPAEEGLVAFLMTHEIKPTGD